MRSLLAFLGAVAVVCCIALAMVSLPREDIVIEEDILLDGRATKPTRAKAPAHMKRKELQRNCMRTKAYAKVAFDKLSNAGSGLGLLHPLFKKLAGDGEVSKKDTPANCVKEYDAFLQSERKSSGIRRMQMLDLDKAMNKPGGILLTASKGAKKVVSPNGAKMGLAARQRPYKGFGVSLTDCLGLGRKMLHAVAKAISMGSSAKKPYKFTKKMYDYLFKGACMDTKEALDNGYTEGCPKVTSQGPRACRNHIGCQWSGSWNGKEEEEEEVVAVDEEANEFMDDSLAA